MDQNEKTAKLTEAIETKNMARTGQLIVELFLDSTEDVSDIAADFVENEIGRLDWMNNWRLIKSRENPVLKVQAYLDKLGLLADPQAVVNEIDRMMVSTPGRWK